MDSSEEIIAYLYKTITSKGLKRIGDDLYFRTDSGNTSWSKYKYIEDFVRSLEGVPFEKAIKVKPKNIHRCIEFLENYESTDYHTITFNHSLIQFSNGLYDISKGKILTETEILNQKRLTNLLSSSSSVDPSCYNDACLFDKYFKDVTYGYALLGYILDRTPDSVWDNVTVMVCGQPSAIDDFYKVLSVIFGPSLSVNEPLKKLPNEIQISAVFSSTTDSEVKKRICFQTLAKHDTPKILLLESGKEQSNTLESCSNRIVKLYINSDSQVSTSHFLGDISKIAAKTSHHYQTVTDSMKTTNTHPVQNFKLRKRKAESI